MRRLILRDSLALFSLAMATVILFAVTLLLFRSFTAHRAALAQSWSQQGRQALAAHRPAEAIADLRTALIYAPGTRAYELLLAQALGDAGQTEESYNRFSDLWAAEPGNGEVNLALARLAAKRAALDTKEKARRQDQQAAIDFYRAAINGTWQGDGATRRPEVRLELARYLVSTDDLASARMELLIAGGNAPEDPALDLTIADLLQQTADSADAWVYYQKAVAADPTNPIPLEAAGRFAFNSDDFADAHRLLARALVEHARSHPPTPADPAEIQLTSSAERILELDPAPTLPARERVAHILAARAIARKRLAACSLQLASAAKPSASLASLTARWSTPASAANSTALLQDPSLQESATALIYDTEVQTANLCTAPTGDDALLLTLATSPHPNLPVWEASTRPVLPHE
jgi:Tfp pilus assembly protein PilF